MIYVFHLFLPLGLSAGMDPQRELLAGILGADMEQLVRGHHEHYCAMLAQQLKRAPTEVEVAHARQAVVTQLLLIQQRKAEQHDMTPIQQAPVMQVPPPRACLCLLTPPPPGGTTAGVRGSTSSIHRTT